MLIQIIIITIIMIMIASLMGILMVETLHATKNISKKRSIEKHRKMARLHKRVKNGVYIK